MISLWRLYSLIYEHFWSLRINSLGFTQIKVNNKYRWLIYIFHLDTKTSVCMLVLWSPLIFSKENKKPLESEQPHLTMDVVQNVYFSWLKIKFRMCCFKSGVMCGNIRLNGINPFKVSRKDVHSWGVFCVHVVSFLSECFGKKLSTDSEIFLFIPL